MTYNLRETLYQLKAEESQAASDIRLARLTMQEENFLAPNWPEFSEDLPLALMCLMTLSVGVNPAEAFFEDHRHISLFAREARKAKAEAEEKVEDLAIAIAITNSDTASDAGYLEAVAQVKRYDEITSKLEKLTSRMRDFYALKDFSGMPEMVARTDSHGKTIYRLQPFGFANWAIGRGWDLPDGFPGLPSAEPKKQPLTKKSPSADQANGWVDRARVIAFEFIQKWGGNSKPSMEKTVAPAVAKQLKEEGYSRRGGGDIKADTVKRQALKGYDAFMAMMTENK